ncbi:MAG TPA: murein L,D-transpeptidase catalytic domain family protein [Thermomonas sp.]|nr:murein L,D-transpeptidase catalytic domain family protein [Thermomonas sp.]
MRDLRLAFTLSASALLAGCAGPATKSGVVAATPHAARVPAVVIAPERAPEATAPSAIDRLRRLAPELDPGVLALALEARSCAVRNGQANADARLAVIDYSLPSTQKRLWVFDVAQDTLLFREHVAHGQGSGENVARRFSNVEGSYQTSLGLFRTAETYHGGNGYSLRMDGLDPGFNDAARQRAIVMHGAWYANPDLIRTQGRLGRSQGCPALREGVARIVIDSLKQQQLVFAYADDAAFLQRGRSFACDGRSAGQILASARQSIPGGGVMTAAVAAP